jgi:predicted metal-dependent hydrolase
MNILFPSGERGFIRVLGQARYLVKDVELQHRIDDFVHQEAQHARAHSIVAQQSSFCGKHTTRATNITEALVRVMFGRKNTRSRSLLLFRVAIVAAIEHLTAEMGRWAFEDARFAELECDPVMTELITWHCAEEVIHRSVAFDTLVDIAPRWHRTLRSVAMLMWMPVFFATWILCAQALLFDDKTVSKRLLTPAHVHRSSRSGAMPSIPMLVKRMLPFFRKSFHPDSVVSQETNAACVAYLEIPVLRDNKHEERKDQDRDDLETKDLHPFALTE